MIKFIFPKFFRMKGCLNFVIICFLLFMGCQNKTADVLKMKSQKQQTISGMQEEVSEIRLSTGGGFTGLYQGFTFHSDGKIEQWQQDRAGKLKILKSRQGDAKEFMKFRKELERDDLFKLKLTQTGNMTTKIVYQKGGSIFVWTWQAGREISPQMQKWYDSITTFCKQQIQ